MEPKAWDTTSPYRALLETGSCPLQAGTQLDEQMRSENGPSPFGWHEEVLAKGAGVDFSPRAGHMLV